MLRSATVLLHAALEEVFRSTALWKYPAAQEDVLNSVPLVGSESGRPEKFFLGRLAAHREKGVQDLIEESVQSYVNAFNVNNTGDIAAFARTVAVNISGINGEFPTLDELFKRRHHIVHQGDRNDEPGQGNHRARSISEWRVNRWIEAVNRLGNEFLDRVPE